MSRHIILSLLIVYIICHGLCAQDFHISVIGDNDGLLHRYNDHILKRSDGIIWISSEYGIYEYDSKFIKHYVPTSDSRGPFGEMVLSNFIESEAGLIYFSTYKGVNKFNIERNEFSLLSEKEGRQIWSSENYLIDVKGNNVFYVSDDTIQVLNQKTLHHSTLISTKSVKQFTRIIDDRLLVIGCPWFNEYGYEVFFLKNYNSASRPELVSHNIHTSDQKKKLYPYFSDLLLESDSTMWALADEGLYYINYIKNSTVNIYHTTQLPSKFLNVTRVNKSTLAISTKDNGIWIFNTDNRQFRSHITTENGLTSDGIREVYFDDNLIWASCISSSDIHIISDSGYYDQFRTISSSENDSQIFEIPDKSHVIYTSSHSLLSYTTDGMVLHEDVSYQSPFDIKQCIKTTILNDFTNQPFVYICDGEVYSSLKNKFALVYKNKTPIHAGAYLSDSTFAGLSNEGIFIYNVNRHRKELLLNNGHQFNFTDVSRIYSDYRYLYIVENEKTVSIFSNSNSMQALNITMSPGPSIFSIHTTPVFIYLATSEGVYQYDKKNISLINHIPLDPFLEEPHIYKIFSHNNDLWMSSNQGILKYNLDDKLWSVFKKENGYTTDFFLENKGIQTSSGHIWFESDEEFVVFHPDSIRTYHNNADLLITDLKVNSKKITQQEIENASLSHKEKNISFTLNYPSYYLSKLNKIYYKIEGLHQNWQTSSTNRVQLSLAPGKYKVNAYGINAHGQKSNVSKLDIEVALPYWRTWWFFLTSLAAVALGVSLIVRYIYKRRLYVQDLIHQNELEVQEKLSIERQRIAAEMHDELGGGLTSIRLISSKVRSSLGNDSRDPSLEKIEDYSLELIDNMRSIIWSMNSEFDTLGESVSYIRQFLVKTLNDNNIACQFKTSGNIDERAVSSDKRRAIFLTVKEIVHNILKHSKASQVQVDIAAHEELLITIADNGEGISATKINNPYNYGLRNIKDRIHNIGGTLSITNQKGVTIHIKVPL